MNILIDSISEFLGLSENEGSWLAVLVGGLVLSIFLPLIGGLALLFTAFLFFGTGTAILVSKDQNDSPIPNTSSAPLTNEPTIADKIKTIHIATQFKCSSCGASIKPTGMKCTSCGTYLVASADLPQPARWGESEPGQAIQILHPLDGMFTTSIKSRVYYGELWQSQMKKHIPWTLTGNYFIGLTLETSQLLLNWQERFFLLTSSTPLTDYSIQNDFAPHARKFAASNQTKDVNFKYSQTTWHIDDIGKFRIEYIDGDNSHSSPGAVGRFIHASNKENVLVVEDYESGGRGQDKVWLGLRIEEKDITL